MGTEPRRSRRTTADAAALPLAESRDAVEALVEADESLVPRAPSALLVEPAVLEPAEVAALLADLEISLERADGLTASATQLPLRTDDFNAGGRSTGGAYPGKDELYPFGERAPTTEGTDHEPDAPTSGRDRRDSQLPPSAWLFADDAGAGRPARHQQGHHLRARRGARKEARPAPRQAQGSLFGDHR